MTRWCIAGGRLMPKPNRDQLTPAQRFRRVREMAVRFADLPEAWSPRSEIDERCAFAP